MWLKLSISPNVLGQCFEPDAVFLHHGDRHSVGLTGVHIRNYTRFSPVISCYDRATLAIGHIICRFVLGQHPISASHRFAGYRYLARLRRTLSLD